MFSSLINSTITLPVEPGVPLEIPVNAIIKAVLILVLGVFIAKIAKRQIIKASRKTTHVWIINEDTAAAISNLIIFVAIIQSLDALGVLSYEIWGMPLSNMLTAILVFYFAYLLAKKSKDYMITRTPQSKLPEVQVKAKLFYYTVIILAFFLALNIAGISGELGTLMAAAGITGIILGFSAQTVVSNFVSGVFMYFDKPLQIGDAVRLKDTSGTVVEGVVEDIRIMSTRIRQWDGTLLRIPNDKLFNSEIVNLQKYPARRTTLEIGIAYSADAERAIKVIEQVLEEEPYVLAIPAPRVYVDRLEDSSVVIKIWAWTPSSLWIGENLLRSKYHLLQRIKETLDREGIEIPFPQRVNWFANELKVRIEEPLEEETAGNQA
ncbi:mechanosensitive ion channel family protein [Thermococcus barossii]|uniref:Mechanosensitive ion channel protein MscS n=1 Tax=Thermococcus barossii TaxID=54077 RepID=A0A2Z2MBU3_9EURY|nr:mechanosensitive ion channel family protein [Thermococcus barossii]ASJ03907.1 mechanosensitive ion channel protein MscS [Thermococcus barossii]